MIKKVMESFLPPSSAACRSGDPLPYPRALVPKRILFVDDEPFIRALMEKLVSNLMIADLTVATSVARARQLLTGFDLAPYDLIILDVVLTNGSGIQLYAEILTRWPDVRVIFLTGHDSEEVLRKVEAIGPARVQNKISVMTPAFLSSLLEQMGIRRRTVSTPPFA